MIGVAHVDYCGRGGGGLSEECGGELLAGHIGECGYGLGRHCSEVVVVGDLNIRALLVENVVQMMMRKLFDAGSSEAGETGG